MTHFKQIPLIDSPIHEVAMRLFAYDNHKLIPGGTCVLIAKDFAVTAKHVVQNIVDKSSKNGDGSIDVHFWAQRTLSGPEYAIWEIENVWLAGLTDIAFLRLKPYNDTAFNNPVTKQCMIDFNPPKVGSTVIGFGYHGKTSESKMLFSVDGKKHLEINDLPYVTMGTVEEIYPQKRDSVLLSFPSFRVAFQSKPGMSGGPVFNNSSGNLVGVVSSGVDGHDIANVCLLWPSVLTQIQTSESTKTILDYIKQGVIGANGYDQIVTSPDLGFLYR